MTTNPAGRLRQLADMARDCAHRRREFIRVQLRDPNSVAAYDGQENWEIARSMFMGEMHDLISSDPELVVRALTAAEKMEGINA